MPILLRPLGEARCERSGFGRRRWPGALASGRPDPRVRTGLHGPSQTGVNDLAAAADGLCLFDLDKRRSSVADREEQLGVLAQARRAVSPRHLGSGFLDRGLEICAPISALPTWSEGGPKVPVVAGVQSAS